MPKSKREKTVSLTKTKKKGKEHKTTLIGKLQDCFDKFERLFVLSAKNLQNAVAEELREGWNHSRMFFAKNTIMAHALGYDRETEYRRNLHKVSLRLHGPTGLLFTNSTEEQVLKWFEDFKREIFACAGDLATETVVLKAGPLKMFQHTMEERLRNLGLPTELNSGVINLLRDYKVCEKGAPLTASQARILKLFDHKMYTFQVTVECVWSNEKFKAFTLADESLPVQKKTSKGKKAKEDEDEAEMLVDEDEDDDDDEQED